ncbi:class I SAM-dependent methyltransferase [bacterium]|nr:class I SAM-dependent methyltransferase [bacterium]
MSFFSRFWPKLMDLRTPAKTSDGRDVWSVAWGKTYKDFWTRVAADRQGACLITRERVMSDPDQFALCKGLAESMARCIAAGPDKDVLEVGGGMGAMAVHIAPLCKSFTAADISATMIEHQKRALAHLSNVRYCVLARCDLSPFPDASLDGVLFEAVLMHMDKEDSFRYMEETKRVLRPGGRAYFQFHNLMHPDGWAIFEATRKHHCDGAGTNIPTRCRMHTADEVRFLLSRLGFVIDEELSQLEPVRQKNKIHVFEHALIATVVNP